MLNIGADRIHLFWESRPTEHSKCLYKQGKKYSVLLFSLITYKNTKLM